MAAKLKKGDEVIVLTGKDRGKTGQILKVFPEESRVIVAGLNKVKKHTKASHQSAGGIEEKEAPLHISNVAYAADGKPSRVGFKIEADGAKKRFAKRTGETISENRV
jgi:large subunit ribosomal protein L24